MWQHLALFGGMGIILSLTHLVKVNTILSAVSIIRQYKTGINNVNIISKFIKSHVGDF